MRVCDLDIKIEGSKLTKHIDKLFQELESRGLLFKPHFWLSDEFFCPSTIPGIAIPFYLAHPRLEKLEKRMMFEVEGSSTSWAMRILRHETGHAIENAFRLARKKERRRIFGSTSKKYPTKYSPRPFSKSYVLNLENGYGQSHPDEDFAETFAIWLNPNSRWRVRYKDWPALKKLEYMDTLMLELMGKKPPVHTRATIDSVRTIKKTLREHYLQKRERFGLDISLDIYDRDLKRLFSYEPEFAKNKKASTFIREHQYELRKKIGYWTGQYRYTIDRVIERVVERCDELDLRLMNDETQSREDLFALLTVQTMNYLHNGGYQVAL